MNYAANLFALDRAASVRSSGGDACLLSQPSDGFGQPTALERLCRTLDLAFDRSAQADEPSHQPAFTRSVRAALAEAAADAALLTSAQREGAADSYRRHLLAADPLGRYAVAALVWMPGQASRVHAHHTWCGYAVIDGTLTENIYGWIAADQCASEVRTHPRSRGAVSFTRAGYTGIHRLGNASDVPAISLHLYGVPGTQLATHVNDFVRLADQRVSA
ncbi:putative metal-dependent enzyme (double-stranded beta helix superfamily) [Paraburkholderia sp. GAS448]|uniref:cysteine dioxygenase family protein n=1 Tax=Paraburkholderia sp. GAS448 TaxID=3035136 RepID=UPI003D1B1912